MLKKLQNLLFEEDDDMEDEEEEIEEKPVKIIGKVVELRRKF